LCQFALEIHDLSSGQAIYAPLPIAVDFEDRLDLINIVVGVNPFPFHVQVLMI